MITNPAAEALFGEPSCFGNDLEEAIAWRDRYACCPQVQATFILRDHGIDFARFDQLVEDLAASNRHVHSLLPAIVLRGLQTDQRFAAAAFAMCKSPIEKLFLAQCAFFERFSWGSYWNPLDAAGCWFSCDERRETILHAQHAVENYRLDFAFTRGETRVAIELDGHEWHERNKTQAGNDKSRDRALQRLGWKVLRFTGSEIWKDPCSCVAEAVEMAGCKP